MAHTVYKVKCDTACPRCGCAEAHVAVYHFGSTYTVECANCAFGGVDGDTEAHALARYRGKLMEAAAKVVTPPAPSRVGSFESGSDDFSEGM